MSRSTCFRGVALCATLLSACKFDPPPRIDSDAAAVDATPAPPRLQVSQPTLTIVENGTDTVSVSLSGRPAGDVEVTISASDPLVTSVSPPSMTFTPDDFETPRALEIVGLPDDDFIDDTTVVTLSADGATGTAVEVTVSEATPPSVPLPRKPLNDAYLGTIALTGSLRPVFTWSTSTIDGPATISYELQISTDAAFLTAVTTVTTVSTSHQPASDLSVPMTAPVGARYYWRVRACIDEICSARSPTWWVNVGRSDQDFNGDGYADVIAGSELSDPGGLTDAGSARVYFGGTGGTFNTTADGVLTGGAAGDHFGISVASAGDVNGDGFADVVVGSYGATSGIGRAYVYFGGAGLALDGTADRTLTGPELGDLFGYAVSSAGDVNADGFADLVVGAFADDANGTEAGRAYLYFGGAGGVFDASADGVLSGAAASNEFGCAVASTGDVNGDGFADVVIGARGNDSGGTNTGRSYVYLGGAGVSFDPTVDGTLIGEAGGDEFGYSVASAGDANGDGYADVVVGAHKHDGGSADTGRAYVYFGGATMTFDTVADGRMTGVATGDFLGVSVASAGDVNGDGFADVVVGAWLNNNASGSDAGAVYIFRGGSGGTFDAVADATLGGSAAGDDFGYAAASAGDVNGDGFADVIVGAVASDVSGLDAGAALIFLGSSGPFDSVADGTLAGAAAGDFLGISVAAVVGGARQHPSGRLLRRSVAQRM